jgi:MinD superfamily P-loop ATPase
VTGVDLVLVITEPTLSGLHDLERVIKLTRHFRVKTLVCVNKWDLNAGLTRHIEARARQCGVEVAGRIRYDPAVIKAQIKQQSLVEFTTLGGAQDIERVWMNVSDKLGHLAQASRLASR